MIHKLYKLSKYIPNEYFDDNPYGLETIERKENVIVLEFLYSSGKNKKNNAGQFVYKGSHLEQYDKRKNQTKYFFKRAPANSVSDFPTVFVSPLDVLNSEYFSTQAKKTSKLIRILKKSEAINPGISQLSSCINTDKDKISTNLAQLLNDVSKKQLYILTVSINDKFIGEAPIFEKIREACIGNFYHDYYMLGKKEIIGKEKICSVCLNRDKEVWGYVSTFNFYTAKTEHAPIAGGFKKEYAWRNYPVCSDCAVILKDMRTIVEKYMRYYFCGLSYYLIPDFIVDSENNREIIEIFLDPDTAIGKFSLNKHERNTITNYQREILDILKDTENVCNYTLFFFEQNQQQFKILLNIQDVYPMQFRRIFKAKEHAEDFSIFKDIPGKDETYDLVFRFELIREFFPIDDKVYGYFKKSFLSIVRSVFLEKKLNRAFILNRFMQVIRQKFANEKDKRNRLKTTDILKAVLILKFFYFLGIIDMDNENEKGGMVYMEKMYEDFFNTHSEFFNGNTRKAVFLEGVLCQNLLNIQFRDRNATPFRKKLNGLKLNEKLIKKLLPEIIEKLEQYGKNYYRKLEELISELLLDSTFSLSDNELSFTFVMGMNLAGQFKLKEEEGNNDHGA
ncbi:MAG: TIGR02556 family CRISPR-associated protein [Spirochaetales bacterium]|nr:TIGR02556 family CRISPR-associated protein [Spirochaetales bacterium]